MQCPYNIQPHQIQGLDYAKIFPVIQWLVKQALMTQENTQAKVLKEAHSYYRRLKEEDDILNIKDLSSKYAPKRQFKTLSMKKLKDPIRIFSTLLEFGDNSASAAYEQYLKTNKAAVYQEADEKTMNRTRTMTVAQAEKRLSRSGTIAVRNEEIKIDREEVLERSARSNKQQEDSEVTGFDVQTEAIDFSGSSRVRGQNVAKIVRVNEIQEAMQGYLENKKGENPELLQKKLEKDLQNRQLAALNLQIENKNMQKAKAEEELESLNESLRELRAKLQDAADLNERLEETIQNIEENSAESKKNLSASQLSSLETLTEKLAAVKEQQRQFREQCNHQISSLESERDAEVDPELQDWFSKVEQSYNDTNRKYQSVKTILAEQNQKVAILQRRIENTPSKTELSQYQRRFVELYEQINLKLEESRKYYNNYNNLLETRELLNSQIQVLQSFQKGYAAAKRNKDKEEFAASVKQAIDQVYDKNNLAKQKLKELTEKVSTMEVTLMKMEEQERLYYQIIKEFQEEIGELS